jgi:INO80 complex subunit B
MPKKRIVYSSESESDDDEEPITVKRPHKAKYVEEESEEEEEEDIEEEVEMEEGLEEELSDAEEEEEDNDESSLSEPQSGDIYSDEEDFLEEVKNDKEFNPTHRLTARQRLKDKKDIFMQLPTQKSPKKKTKAQSDLESMEKMQKRQKEAKRRLEEEKAATINRLLNKQVSRVKRKDSEALEDKEAEAALKMIRYINNPSGSVLAFPVGYNLDLLKPQKLGSYPTLAKCAVSKCSQPKKYTCTKNKLPACSLKHLNDLKAK